MDKLYEHVMRESEVTSGILANDLDMTPLIAVQQRDYEDATTCAECGGVFTKSNHKVRHHDHVTGQYLFPACNSCKLTLKMPNRKRKVTQGQVQNKKANIEGNMEWAEDKYATNFFLPVVFHNLKSYDAHFVIKHFKKQYTARCRDQDDDDDICEQEEESVSYADIRVTPLNVEKYLSFQVGNLRFIDSFQFLSTSLDNLVSLLFKSGRDKFTHTTKFLGDDDLVFAKGVYPYSYMTSPEKFTETQLPPIEAFYNTLEDEPCPVQNYNRACEIWAHYNIKTMRDYHDHYLLSGVLLLADVFENFRNSIYEQHRLDPFIS